MAVGLGAINHAPISGFYVGCVDKWPIYILSVAVGSAITIGSLLIFRGNETIETKKTNSYS